MTTDTHSILTLQCPDQPGIVAAVANLIADVGGNIMNADQHTDRDSEVFISPQCNLRRCVKTKLQRFSNPWLLNHPAQNRMPFSFTLPLPYTLLPQEVLVLKSVLSVLVLFPIFFQVK